MGRSGVARVSVLFFFIHASFVIYLFILFHQLNFAICSFFPLVFIFDVEDHTELVLISIPLPPRSAQTVAVIVRLEKENFQVLNMHGKLVHVKPQAVHKKKENRRAMALDSEQNTIQVKDVVKVIDGPHSVSLSFIFIKLVMFLYVNYYFIYLLSLFLSLSLMSSFKTAYPVYNLNLK